VGGVLVPERDDQALARALLNAAQDPGFLSRIGHAGAEAVRKNFDLSPQAHRLEEIYLNLL
jgi:glycosyltransferase involved in cell wall biosynthesis